MNPADLRNRIFEVDEKNFDSLALDVFRFQYANCEVYQNFCDAFRRTPMLVNSLDKIPFLPVEFFKTHPVYSRGKDPELIFSSSGTTGQETSKHHVAEVKLYEESFMRSFNIFYGDVSQYTFVALLPSYLERNGSSLVYMADRLIRESKNADSGFFLDEFEKLNVLLKKNTASGKKIFLLGVTYALLDLAEKFPQQLKNVIIMETGGMKGKRSEMVREEVHAILKKTFDLEKIHSEYGMTELLSQAYSKGDGIFNCPPWMKIIIREMNDPLTNAPNGKTGGVNIIDLANLYSCSFISTSDLGKKYDDGSFEILGRFDNSDLRGCNLLIEN
ncbi:MAG: acyl transferase [Bacteroidetes bacterium]|nr:acyl transferase [Bacteroidota bacterium]